MKDRAAQSHQSWWGKEYTAESQRRSREYCHFESSRGNLTFVSKFWESSSKKVMQPIAMLKCLYIKAHSTGNKQNKIETMLHLQNYDLIVIKETQWDESHNWNTIIEGYKFFRWIGKVGVAFCCGLIKQVAKHYTVIHLLPFFPFGCGRVKQNNKSRTCGLR